MDLGTWVSPSPDATGQLSKFNSNAYHCQSKPCHQLDAARQLLNLGFHPAQTFIDENTHASPTRKNSAPSAISAVNPSPLHQELAALIREETGNGRTTVRFLVDVMAGNLSTSSPTTACPPPKNSCAAASTPRPLLMPVAQPLRNPLWGHPRLKTKEAPNAWIRARLGRYADYPVGYKRYEIEYGPFDFRSYDDEDYHFDTHGSEALRHISGSEEAASAVRESSGLPPCCLAACRGYRTGPQGPRPPDQVSRRLPPTRKHLRVPGPAADIRLRAGGPDSRLGPPPNTTGSKPPWPVTIPPSGPGPTTAPRYPFHPETCTPHRTRPRRKSIRRTGRRRSWGATRRIQRRNPGGSNSSRKDAGPGPMATRPRAIAGEPSPYDRI